MSSSITFQEDEPYTPITLSIWDDKYAIRAPIVLEDATILENRGSGIIYKAKMKYVDDAAGQAAPETTIVKFSSNHDRMMRMEDEARFYVDHLRTTYGNGVPTFYGLYKGDYSRKDRRGNLYTGKCACLVLQYCGKPLRIALFKQLENDRPFRHKLVKLIERLHIELGVSHGDFYTSDVLNMDGKPFIVDFSDAWIHKCDIEVAIEEGEMRPRPSLLACKELRGFLNSLHTWWLPDHTVWHRGLFVENDDVYSAAEIFEQRSRKIHEDRAWTDEDFWNEAVVAWKTIHSHWAKYHPENPTIPDLGITDYQEYLAQKEQGKSAPAETG
ncbi:hypothetical protein D9615_009764 [Tricholomella constricta]|uniref:Protein kinase domain-containing protein n=1 Tax=Tricholomella constricta TaxID=117010 RepID=A0A8H5GSL2_9AGAR|nr:hypothetical protein D9615_009764 [Tricholomella constricta]